MLPLSLWARFFAPLVVGACFASGGDELSAQPSSSLTLKAEIGRDESLTFGSLMDLTPHPAGGFLVLDGIDQMVHWWHPDQGLVYSVGGVGDGPGEFRRAVSVAALGDQFVVVDAGSLRATGFSWSGDFVADWSLPLPSGTPPMWSYSLAQGEGAIFATAPRTSPIPELVDLHIHLVFATPSGLTLDTVATVHSGIPRWRDPAEDRLFGMRTGHFGVGGAWDGVGNERLLFVDCYVGELRVFDFGDRARVHPPIAVPRLRGRTPNRADEAIAATSLSSAFEAAGRVLPRGVTFELPPMVSSCSEGIAVGPDQLWVRTQAADDADGEVYTVLEVGDGWVGDVSLPHGFRLKAVVDGDFVGFVESEIGEPLIRILTRK